MPKENLFPYSTFPIRLEYNEGADKKICWFQHVSHLEKHLTRYSLDVKKCKINFQEGFEFDSKKFLKENQITDRNTKKLFSTIDTFFNGQGKTKTNRKKPQTSRRKSGV